MMDPADDDPSTPGETLDHVLHHLIPLLLAAALSARSLLGRWRLLHANLLLLRSALSDAAASPNWPSNPLFLSLLPSLLPTLRSLLSLSSRCLDPSLPSGKLLLQSDLDIAASALSLHLHDLSILVRSGLLHHHHPPTAIVLHHPGPGASRADLSLFLRDLFARLQIGALDIKHKALDSLLRLLHSDPAKLAPVVVHDGDLPFLLRLLDPSAHSLIRDRAAAAVSLLATASDASRRAVFDEGGLGPLLRLLNTGSPAVREQAAAAVAALTADSSNAWAVAAYGGVPVLIDACRSGGGRSSAVRALAAAALKNISVVDDLRAAMAEEGAVPALVELLATGTSEAQRDAAVCLRALTDLSGNEIRDAIVQQGGLQRLLQLLREASDPEVIEQSLAAIHAVSALPAAAKALSSSSNFFEQLADLITRGTAAVQLTAARILCELSPCEDIKRSMSGCMAALVKMLEASKPASAQEAAAGALVALLSVRSNRKDLARDEKSMTRLAGMLDPKREEVCKAFPVSVVLVLTSGSCGGCRKRIAEAGACQHLQKLADADVPGAKKALQRIIGGRLKSLFSMGWRE